MNSIAENGVFRVTKWSLFSSQFTNHFEGADVLRRLVDGWNWVLGCRIHLNRQDAKSAKGEGGLGALGMSHGRPDVNVNPPAR